MLVFMGAAVISAGLCLTAALLVPAHLRHAVAWTGGISAVLVSCLLATTVHHLLALRRRNLDAAERSHREQAALWEAEMRRLADEILPSLAEALRKGGSVDSVLARHVLPHDDGPRRIAESFAREVGRAERMRSAAMSACANAAGRVQALTTSMLADLREMENRHGDAEVLADLFKLDHDTAQAGRLADRIAVLTGARSGRRWNKPIGMESVLRGAVGRIGAYERVRLHCSSASAVAGHAAEGVMHVLAEIMDNAASFSPPTSEVHVYVEETQAGIVVTVEDSGLVMDEAKLRRAERAVSADELNLLSLSGTRVGLVVVGCLARKHDLKVFFRPSSRGGTGVVVLIPQQLVTKLPQTPVPQARAGLALNGGEAAQHPPVPSPVTASARQPDADPGTLPQRRRGRTFKPRQTPASSAPRLAPRSAQESAERLSSFRSAVRRTDTAPTTPARTKDETP